MRRNGLVILLVSTVLAGAVAAWFKKRRPHQKNYFYVEEHKRGKHDAFLAQSNFFLSHHAKNSFRQGLLDDGEPGDARNFGCAHVLTNSRRTYVRAYSGGAKPFSSASATLKGLTQAIPHARRFACTEFQILNLLATRLPRNTKAAVDLYTENAPCASCGVVIRQFLEMFPGARIGVGYELGPGNESTWPTEREQWQESVSARMTTKKFERSLGTLFYRGKNYAFIDPDGTRHGFSFLGYDNQDRSVWKSRDDNTVVFDRELYSIYKDVVQTGRNVEDMPLPFKNSSLKRWTLWPIGRQYLDS